MEALAWSVDQFRTWFYETFNFSTKVHHGWRVTELGQELADELRKATEALAAKEGCDDPREVLARAGKPGAEPEPEPEPDS